MDVRPTADPTPFPALPGNPMRVQVPAEWNRADLVRMEGMAGDRAVERTYRATSFGQHGGAWNPFAPKFVDLNTSSFSHALAAARELSATHHLYGSREATQAVAVLQGASGAFFATALSQGGAHATLTPVAGHAQYEFSALHPAVKAVVGADRWVDLSGKGS